MFTQQRKQIENIKYPEPVELIDLDIEFTERANDFDELVTQCDSIEEAILIWDMEY